MVNIVRTRPVETTLAVALVAIALAALTARPHELNADLAAAPAAGGAPSSPATCSLDTVEADGSTAAVVGDAIRIRAHRRATLRGWAFTAAPQWSATGIASQYDGGPRTMGTYFIARPDVANVYHRPDAARSGYDVTFDSGAPGTHRLHLWLTFAGGAIEPLGQTLVVHAVQ